MMTKTMMKLEKNLKQGERDDDDFNIIRSKKSQSEIVA